MAVNDFTGKNIKNTYQRVIQTDGINVADGTGSLLPLKFSENNVIVSGALIAQSYIVSESVLNVSSGSTVFGDSVGDSHTFNGNITASGNISSSVGTITGLTGSFHHFVTDGNTIEFRNTSTRATEGFLQFDATNGLTVQDSNKDKTKIKALEIGVSLNDTLVKLNGEGGHITASGNISASGYVYGERLITERIDHLDDESDIYFSSGINVQKSGGGHITASGNISASGNIIGIIDGGTF